jgi:hypothetical protein
MHKHPTMSSRSMNDIFISMETSAVFILNLVSKDPKLGSIFKQIFHSSSLTESLTPNVLHRPQRLRLIFYTNFIQRFDEDRNFGNAEM